MEGTRVNGQRVCLVSAQFWRVAVFAAALGVSSQSEAATYYWQDSGTVVTDPAPAVPSRRAKTRGSAAKKSNVALKEQAKPQGPLIISISIAQQKLRLYDAHGLYAESPISTGMAGHPTPMGVFSVIQKQKFHRSNIYSGAPMPFMQRITWSGVAMHAGVLPGYPASHGCIRMPTAFAIKMYGWTRMGARVIITPGDVTPASFSHPLLAAIKVQPQPVAVEATKADIAVARAAEKPAQIEASTNAPAAVETSLELRPTVSHDDAKSTADESRVSEIEAADKPASDAAAKTDTPKSQTEPNATKSGETDEKPANDQPAKPATVTTATEAATQGEKSAAAATATPAAPIAATDATPLKDDLKSEFAKAASPLDPGLVFKNSGQIAVFVSRKDSKLYVRQNFSPLFNVPVTIAAGDRPLGTHIFTAQVDSRDANLLHWSVVSLPTPRASARRAEEERMPRGRKIASAGPIEPKPQPVPNSPAEALDRLSLPADVMARIYEAVATGGSIIISDQGIAAGETGEGTDFIVSLR
jgi:lipoprotein-anchoring transpeptidase ErfK/SrfK